MLWPRFLQRPGVTKTVTPAPPASNVPVPSEPARALAARRAAIERAARLDKVHAMRVHLGLGDKVRVL